MTTKLQLQKGFSAAINEAKKGIRQKHGGPFGAAIIKNEKIIALGHNTVLKNNDPTAHAEINAIRAATKKLKSPHLKNCILIATSEPCPMCLTTSYWAKIKAIYYALPKSVADDAGFQDNFIYKDLAKPIKKRKLKLICFPSSIKDSKMIFTDWKKTGKLY
ncbi:MAG: hypothetical protein COU29_01740 [Candidatus Magasanikbacteria bacterium CG10_big_fil_rev_8_21_14_0_10_36_32]|uniref:CMP/dCMP-type deaminase domain-containing protein n=1 Tax=Candidatus Magasanikbacteria bacterium CG10_big_fil_rev_8_21_14_0_10_36_32 TaxID=1974646 RepID=A0A2M6W6W6_9BACT|nr:MAG: hypothetical protein COU29_01740 [Candidatus Magasanikbacteria bacterium CG10_big_fil_rev_8_21_14_0_10_36_32]